MGGYRTMFTKSARYYDALYKFKDYRAASETLHQRIQRLVPGARRLLDVGCGTGQHLQHLSAHYEVAGLDLNPDLIDIARARCPGVPFHVGDMADFDLGRRFDVVTCLFSAIAYVQTLDRMRAAVRCMTAHLSSPGCVLVEPWFTPERYWTGTITSNFAEDGDLRVAWMYTSERRDLVSVLDIHYLVGTPERVQHFTECHELGLFTQGEYMAALEDAGLKAAHDQTGLFQRGLYEGVRGPARP